MDLKIILTLFLAACSLALPAQDAPVTTAGSVTVAVPGSPSIVPVTVDNFIQIGQFTLTLKFDTTRVRYLSAALNPSLQGLTAVYTPPAGNTLGKLVLSWTGASNLSLANGSVLADLNLLYIAGTGILQWTYTYGSVCQYRRWSGAILTPINDQPRHLYYINGGVSNRGAPVVTAPAIAGPEPGPMPVVLTTSGFTGIQAFTLYLEYDPAFIVYQQSYTRNPAFDSNFIVGDTPGFNGKRFLVIQWYGGSVSLPDGAALCTADFSYLTASCSSSPLTWYDNGPTCEFSDASGNILIDTPDGNYYLPGIVAEGLPAQWTGAVSIDWNNPANWTSCGMPNPMRAVVIPNVGTNPYPVITGNISCRSVEVENGARLNIAPTGALTVLQ
jgi:hypothetical protein